VPGRRMSVRDADWLRYDHLRVIGPLVGVTTTTVRDALRTLHAMDPGNPAVCRVDGHRWVPVDPVRYRAALAGDVSELDGDASGEPAVVLRGALAAEPLGDRPVRVLLHRGFAGIRVSHAIGDGRVFSALVPRLFGAAIVPSPRPVRLPLLRATVGYFGRDPRRVGALLRVPRPVLPEPGPHEPSRPWRPDPASHYARSTVDLLPRLREWRAARLPGVSTAAVLFGAARAAFEECGLAPDHPGLMVLVDARRYLSGRFMGGFVGGNFTAAQYLEPSDPRDPRAIHEAIGAAVAAGRPLTSLALRDLHALRSRRATPVPDRVRVHPAPRLTLTHVGRLDGFAGLPWACPPAGRVLMSAPTPGGTEGVTVSFAELDGAIHVNVTYHRSTFDEAAVRRAAELICADPVGLLTGGGYSPKCGSPASAL
jgi:hypothetical protein